VKGFNVLGVDANIFAPVVEHSDPVTEGSNLCYFSRHNYFLIDHGVPKSN
jgi:hypothetical protein